MKVDYKDRPFRIMLGIIAAQIMVLNDQDIGFFEAVFTFSYYRGLIGSFVIAMILIEYIHYVTMRLDIRLDWKYNTLARLLWQTVIGFALPGLIAFLLAAGFFAIFDVNILNTTYLRQDYPLVLLMLLVINLYYFGLNSFLRLRQVPDSNTLEATREVFIVQRGIKNIPLPVNSIAYFFHEAEMNFMRNLDGEDFLIAETLDEVQQQLGAKNFFRANRKMVVHRQACLYFETLEYNKLRLEVAPSYKEPVIISQKRAKNFKEWIGRNGAVK